MYVSTGGVLSERTKGINRGKRNITQTLSHMNNNKNNRDFIIHIYEAYSDSYINKQIPTRLISTTQSISMSWRNEIYCILSPFLSALGGYLITCHSGVWSGNIRGGTELWGTAHYETFNVIDVDTYTS